MFRGSFFLGFSSTATPSNGFCQDAPGPCLNSLPVSWWLGSKESACSAGDPGSIPGSGRPPGEGNGNPLQYCCLENPMDRGAWRATVPGVAKSWAQLGD